MSRCFKHYDVKQLRHSGCVPATREIPEGVMLLFIAKLASLRFSINSAEFKDN